MSESGNHTAWNCPSCTKRVPWRVEVCRCGHARPHRVESLPTGSSETRAAAPGARTVSPSLLIVLGAVVGIGAVVFAFRMQQDKPDTAVSASSAAGALGEPPASQPSSDGADDPLVAPVVGRVELRQ